MEYTSKIKEITDVKEYHGDKGTVYYLSLVMENDMKGSLGKKRPDALKVGDEITYTAEDSSFGWKFKQVQSGGSWGGNSGGGGRNAQGSAGSARSFSLSYAKDVEVALINGGLSPTGVVADGELTQNILDRADAFLEWLEKGSTTQQTSTDTVSAEPEQAFTGSGDWANQEDAKPEKTVYPPKPKPAKGNFNSGGKQVSPAQLGLLKKLTLERDLDVNHLIMAEWDDVESANDLTSAAASFLIEQMLKGDQ